MGARDGHAAPIEEIRGLRAKTLFSESVRSRKGGCVSTRQYENASSGMKRQWERLKAEREERQTRDGSGAGSLYVEVCAIGPPRAAERGRGTSR